jgi:membrane protease YdiL (CAAX protease family)
VAAEPDPQSSLGDAFEFAPTPLVSDDLIPVAALAGPRFCRECGAPRQPHWTSCPQCDAKRTQTVEPLSIAVEHRALKSALALYFCLLAVCAIGMLVATGQNGLDVELGETIALSAITLGWCVVSWRSVLPLLTRMAHPAWLAAAVGLAFVSFGVAMGVIRGLVHLMHVPYANESTPFFQAGYGWGMLVLCVCIQPAVIEELAFRGVLQKALGPAETIVVSAMMFMILHLSVARFPHTLALGLASGFMRYRTRSLYPCMLMHFSHNLLCILSDTMMR